MTPSDVRIGDRVIGSGRPPYIIAEMSGNHNQSLDRALQIVEAAASTGVDALKLQTYTADTMTLDLEDEAFQIRDPKSLWYGQSLHALYQQAYTPWEWHELIFRRCRELGMEAFSSPFDAAAVDFLESIDAPAYKIASFENVDLPLIRRAAATGKPLIISTGMASLAEIHEAVDAAQQGGCRDLILLKCTSAYPAPVQDANLRTIPHMREAFGVQVGLSDHTLGVAVSLAAVVLGASVIEKHLTLDRTEGGVDAAFSLEPDEMKRLVEEARHANEALGYVTYGPTPSERSRLRSRRSLYVVADLEPGDELTKENLRALRPGRGLPPKYYDVLLGKRVAGKVTRGTPASWSLISESVP